MTRLSKLTRLACVPRNCSGDLLFFISTGVAVIDDEEVGWSDSPRMSISHGLLLLLVLLFVMDGEAVELLPIEHRKLYI